MDQLRGARPDGMDAQESLILSMDEQFQKPTIIAQYLPSRNFPVSCDARFIRNFLLCQFIFGRPNGRDFRDGIDADGKVFGHGFDIDTKRVTRRQSSLKKGSGGQAWRSNDISHREDM